MLELKNVSYNADGEKEIIDDVSIKIDGKIVVITGPNGGGKSTLVKIIAGLIKPTSGRIILDGVDITDMSVTDRAKAGVSIAFQQPVRFKGLTVRDLITIASGKDITLTEACSYLSEVGLCAKDYINRNLDGSLSGGEMKRIEIAMILARKSKFSIFDEPEAGIDLWSFSSLIHTFEQLHDSTQGTILIISHQERILNIADKIIYIKDGKIERYENKDNILPELLSGSVKAGCDMLMNKMEAGKC